MGEGGGGRRRRRWEEAVGGGGGGGKSRPWVEEEEVAVGGGTAKGFRVLIASKFNLDRLNIRTAKIKHGCKKGFHSLASMHDFA